jgi:hypothetical protein
VTASAGFPYTPDVPERFIRQLLTAAWLSVALGLFIELALVLLSTVFRGGESFNQFIADLVQKLSWSTLVCVGLALGLAATKLRTPVMGVLGLLSAPLAFGVAKAAHKSAAQALQVVGSAAPGPTPLQFAIVRAVEYALLGVVIAIISRKTSGTLRMHAATGLAFGLVFCGIVLLLTVQNAAATPTAYQLAAKSINELLFPLGCSLVLYAAHSLGKRAKADEPAAGAES